MIKKMELHMPITVNYKPSYFCVVFGGQVPVAALYCIYPVFLGMVWYAGASLIRIFTICKNALFIFWLIYCMYVTSLCWEKRFLSYLLFLKFCTTFSFVVCHIALMITADKSNQLLPIIFQEVCKTLKQ